MGRKARATGEVVPVVGAFVDDASDSEDAKEGY